jgi:hypothetical protein
MKTRSLVLLIAVAAVLAASAGSVSAAYVATFAGPKDFNGSSDYQVLNDVSVGLEGSVSMEFKLADNTATGIQQLWFAVDSTATDTAEYSVAVDGYGTYDVGGTQTATNRLAFTMWNNAGGYIVKWKGYVADNDWHKITATWKDGFDTLVTLDGGAAESVVNGGGLIPFTTTPGNNSLGACWGNTIRFFGGTIQNFAIGDTYLSVPEPSTWALLSCGLMSYLAYAWRKRT